MEDVLSGVRLALRNPVHESGDLMLALTLMCTALPRRTRNGALELTAFLSMRLEPGTAANYPFLSSWPAQLSTAQFVVLFSDGTSAVARATLAGDRAVFEQVFPLSTPIRDYRSESLVSSGEAVTFDAAGLDALVRDVYATVAADPATSSAPPRLADSARVKDVVWEIGPLVRRRIARESIDPRDLSPEARLAHEFEEFHGRYTPRQQLPLGDVQPFDFHERATLLGDFPALLRKCGFAVDLTVDDPAVMGAPPIGELTVTVSFGSAMDPTPTILANSTAYELDAARGVFRAAPRTASSDVREGMLRLGGGGWSLAQGELDGAASKLIDFCANTYKRAVECPAAEREPVALPALASGGFTVFRAGRLDAVRAALDEWRSRDQHVRQGRPSPDALYAEDLVRGYRIDVQRNDEPWRSLCRRAGIVTFPDAALQIPIDDEGYVKAASASVTLNVDGHPERVKVHEATFGWDGWSLCARRPGRFIGEPTGAPGGAPIQRLHSVTPPGAGFSMGTEIDAAPGTLPRLRFGDRYRLRARVVDLAGDGLSLAEGLEAYATPRQTYLRFEPVPSPVLVPRERMVEGESVEHVVVRSIVDDEALAHAFPAVSKDSSDRHVAPAKTSQAEAEIHGVFDAFMTRDIEGAYLLALREEGTFLDREVRLSDGRTVPVTDMEIVAPPGVSTSPPRVRGDGLAPGAYVIHKGEEVRVPYLSDAFASGVSLRAPFGDVARAFEGSWPGVRATRLRVVKTSGAVPTISAGTGSTPIEIALPPATIVRVQVSSTMRADDVSRMWVFGLIEERASAANVARSRQLAVDGRIWMMTPARELTLVHAVQKPLRAPRVTGATLSRPLGATWVDWTSIALDVDAHSTGVVDVTAEWTDVVDAGGVRADIARSGHACHLRVPYDDTTGIYPKEAPEPAGCRRDEGGGGPPPPRMRQEIGDTKHHAVKLRATGTTRFREYYPRDLWLDERNLESVGAVSPREEDVLHIPSSTPPDPPKIAYVLPTFEWKESSENARQRVGGGLRIYLERPWYGTGAGELLAALVPASGQSVSADDAKYVSQWGHDPIWSPANRSTLPAQLTAAHFVKADGDPFPMTVSAPLLLPEQPSLRVVAVGFEPKFSDERGLWYVDVELDAGTAYFPFVRLALARYQPHSIESSPGAPGIALSRVVRADFVQLTANRTATLAYDVARTAVVVTVAGPTASSAGRAEPGGAHRVSVVVQSRPPLGSDLLWRDEPGGVDALPLSGLGGDGVAMWSGTVPLPARVGEREYQILITEREIYAAEPGAAERARIVYADAFPLM
ncbi:hypothetical protein WME95_05725 [Sorangium sp. So ce327]|uniref:hypothetical protein n=1 Tax=Sorangium sp. So ce327 TaxID=3133301 RepID=UPI003F62AB89